MGALRRVRKNAVVFIVSFFLVMGQRVAHRWFLWHNSRAPRGATDESPFTDSLVLQLSRDKSTYNLEMGRSFPYVRLRRSLVEDVKVALAEIPLLIEVAGAELDRSLVQPVYAQSDCTDNFGDCGPGDAGPYDYGPGDSGGYGPGPDYCPELGYPDPDCYS
jgi:hypothetical protein